MARRIIEMPMSEYMKLENHTFTPGLGIKSEAKNQKVPADKYETGKLEREVRKDVQKILKTYGYLSTTVYVGPIPTGTGAMATNPMKGFPDQIAMNLSRRQMFYVELKRNSGGVLTPEQQTWHHDLRRCGQTVIVVTSGEMLLHWMLENHYT